MKKVLIQRHKYNAKNVSASPDSMVKMLSGKIKYIFPDFSFKHRRMCVHRRYTLKDVLLWSTAKCWEKNFPVVDIQCFS